jgi:hypothetical protein
LQLQSIATQLCQSWDAIDCNTIVVKISPILIAIVLSSLQ